MVSPLDAPKVRGSIRGSTILRRTVSNDRNDSPLAYRDAIGPGKIKNDFSEHRSMRIEPDFRIVLKSLLLPQGKKSDDCRCYGNASKCDSTMLADRNSRPAPQQRKQTCPPPCCPCPCPAEKCKVTLQTVQKLVEAENKDVELSELLSGITILDERRPKQKIIDMYDAKAKIEREDPVRRSFF